MFKLFDKFIREKAKIVGIPANAIYSYEISVFIQIEAVKHIRIFFSNSEISLTAYKSYQNYLTSISNPEIYDLVLINMNDPESFKIIEKKLNAYR